ncbi:MAG: hypothetical protein ACO3OZ_16205 [bacterium]
MTVIGWSGVRYWPARPKSEAGSCFGPGNRYRNEFRNGMAGTSAGTSARAGTSASAGTSARAGPVSFPLIHAGL